MGENGDEATDSTGRRRVLVLIKELGLGGAERLVVGLVSHGDRDRFDYEVAFVLDGHDALASELVDQGVPVHDLGAASSSDLRWVPRLRNLLVTGSFDVLHSHLPYTAAFGRLAARSVPRSRRPVLVYTEHSLWNRAAVLTRSLNGSTSALDDALLVVTPAARDALPRRLRGKARVLVHGIDLERSASLLARRDTLRAHTRSTLGLDDRAVLALTVANLREEKGYDVLLEAARRIRGRAPCVHFASVGWGPLQDRLAQERDALGLADTVTFLGRRPDVLELMVGADLFVLPSHQEGLPVALMEAMSVGLPVVASQIGGVPDVVTDGIEGILVPPGRPDALAEAVTSLAADEDRRQGMGRASLARSRMFDVTAAEVACNAPWTSVVAP